MKKIYVLLIFIQVTAASAMAESITSAGSGNWNSTTPNAPWPGGIIPSVNDNVSIRPGDNIMLTTSATIYSLTFSGTSNTPTTLSVNSGVVFTVITSIVINNAIGNSTLTAFAGAGTINCATLKVGGIATTGFTSDRSTGFFLNINAINISGDLIVKSEDEINNQNNSTFTHTTGTINVGGSVVIDAENDGEGTGFASAVYTMNGGGAESGTLNIAGASPFLIPGSGVVIFDANGNSNTVIYSGNDQTIKGTVYRNLVLSGSGTKTLTNVASVNGNMTLSGTTNSIFLANFTVVGNLNSGNGTTLTLTGFDFTALRITTVNGTLISNSTTGTKTFDNLVISNSGVFNSAVDEDYFLTGNLQIDTAGSFVPGSGLWTWSASGTFSGTAAIANIKVDGIGTFSVINNGTLTVDNFSGNDGFVQGANAVFSFNGSVMSHTGPFIASSVGNTVNYTGAAQTIRSVAYQNLVLSGSNIKTLDGNTTVNATLSLRETAVLSDGTSGIIYGASSTLEYSGSVAQTTSNVEFKASGGPANLKINNNNGVTLHDTRTIPGLVLFANGILNTTSSSLLIIGPLGNVSGASDASFVNGPVKKIGAIGAAGFNFPVGKTGVGYMKIGIANVTGATTEFTAQYFRASAAADFDTIGLIAIGLQAVSTCEYWTLNRSVTRSDANVTLSWNEHSSCNSYYLSDRLSGIRLAHFNGSIWDAHGGGSPSGNKTSGSITWSGVNSFGPFALAAMAGSSNLLPVMFYNVKSYEKNHGVQVEWTNLTERDLVSYVVERSPDGQHFTIIKEQPPRGNQNDKESYSAFDAAPFSGINYYRIKAMEISGKIIYSKVMMVAIGNTVRGFSIYPNPVQGNQVSVSMNGKKGQYSVKILNTAGQEMYSVRLNHQGDSMSQTIDIPYNIRPGVYNMMISGDNYLEAKMFLVQ
ncbi:MAG TPA: T9SS type A sorting domain-containing protein [Chitinophagaceae bacterium]|nr:T9SS type A sorting domain-containing protein [Chitinophagaceae bacterium]